MQFISSHISKIVIALTIIVMASCENDIKVVQALGKKRIGVEEGTKIEAYQSQGGKVKAKLSAPVMYRYLQDSERVEFPRSLHVESQLYASYGRYLENDKKVLLKDSVIVFNVKKDTLWCKELYWDQFKQQFYTDKPIHLSQNNPRQIIYGRGLTADQNFKWFTIDSLGKIFTGHESVLHVADSTY